MSTPPRAHSWGWSYEDLELDPFLDPSGAVGVDDRDEFEDAVRAGTIDVHEAAAVELHLEVLTYAMASRHEPFGSTAVDLLSEMSGRAHAPLRALDATP